MQRTVASASLALGPSRRGRARALAARAEDHASTEAVTPVTNVVPTPNA